MLRKELKETVTLAQYEFSQEQVRQKKHNDAAVRPRVIQLGQKVLLLLSSSKNKLLFQWQGLYKVVQRKEKVDYDTGIPNKGLKSYHVKFFKE